MCFASLDRNIPHARSFIRAAIVHELFDEIIDFSHHVEESIKGCSICRKLDSRRSVKNNRHHHGTRMRLIYRRASLQGKIKVF